MSTHQHIKKNYSNKLVRVLMGVGQNVDLIHTIIQNKT